MHVAQKSQKVAAGRPAVDAKLVLDQDHLHVVDIEEIGCAAIRIEFLLIDLKSDLRRIVVAFGSVIHRAHDALTLRELRRYSLRKPEVKVAIPHWRGQMIPEEGYLLDVGLYF